MASATTACLPGRAGLGVKLCFTLEATLPSGTYGIFRRAILERKQVVCRYKGLRREVCPQVIGWKDGFEKVLAFQFGGESSQDLPPDGEWRCMFVEQVREASLRDGPWHTGHNHRRPQTCVDEIDVEAMT